jgi:hypothetical protein
MSDLCQILPNALRLQIKCSNERPRDRDMNKRVLVIEDNQSLVANIFAYLERRPSWTSARAPESFRSAGL